MARIVDGVEWLNDRELQAERDLVVSIEKFLDVHMIAQEDLPDGWVIDTADLLLRASRHIYQLEDE